ncbi:hypothetical protein [Candidatus Leptofilum sp.]|uniref:hypothetical protein n=1 Tax=Candidatus Leptofilum sp. TaxID=3241576 RepID=UPI003B5C543F
MDLTANLSGQQKTIVGLTVATALIHIVLGVLAGGTFLIMFLLNGLGYLVLMAALYFLPQFAAQRSLIRWVLLAFTAVTFILYFVFNWPDIWSPIGIVDKLIELALIVLLWQDK